MRRRNALRAMVVLGSVGLGGCGFSDDTTSGNDDDPFEVEPSDLLPPVSVLDDASDITWEPREEVETGLVTRAQVQASYRASNQDPPYPDRVEVGAWTFETVDAARDAYEDLPYHEGWGMTAGDVAVESLRGVVNNEREYRAVFRDANAMGGLVYLNRRSGNAERMRRYGEDLVVAMHRSWRD